MPDPETMLKGVARDIADVIPEVDAMAVHDKWKPGIGPFEEERQLGMILDTLADSGGTPYNVEREVPYPGSGRRCDMLMTEGDIRLPVEAKLLRFRRDNGNIDPNVYKSVFSPFPEASSSSLLTDAWKLVESALGPPAGLLGVYYEKEDEPYDQLRADRVADKFCEDVEFWYSLEIETAGLEPFHGLRHPHHQRGAVITWVIPS